MESLWLTARSLVFSQLLQKYQQLYGSPDAAIPSKDSISFDEFKGLFSKPATVASGEGNAVGLAATAADSGLVPTRFTRRATGENDVRIQVCNFDSLHARRGNASLGKHALSSSSLLCTAHCW